MGLDTILINKDAVDMRYVEQIVDSEQLHALAYILKYMGNRMFDGKCTLKEMIEELYMKIEQRGFAVVCEERYIPANLALPRKQEIYACINRYRKVKF